MVPAPVPHAAPSLKRRSAPTISKADYDQLVKENLNGIYPQVAPPAAHRITKEARRFSCCEHGCAFVGTSAGATRRHRGNIHGIGVEWHACDQPGCAYVGKWANQLRQHKQKAHNIDVKWHHCDQPGCTFKTKTTPALRGHKANIHNIGVVWHKCQVPGCPFQTKQRRNLFQHGRWMHSGRTVLHPNRVQRNRNAALKEEEEEVLPDPPDAEPPDYTPAPIEFSEDEEEEECKECKVEIDDVADAMDAVFAPLPELHSGSASDCDCDGDDDDDYDNDDDYDDDDDDRDNIFLRIANQKRQCEDALRELVLDADF